MNTKIWGPHGWSMMHGLSWLQCDSTDIFNFIKSLAHILPCKYCRVSFATFLGEDSPSASFTDREWNCWVVRMHNKVNAKLKVADFVDLETTCPKWCQWLFSTFFFIYILLLSYPDLSEREQEASACFESLLATDHTVSPTGDSTEAFDSSAFDSTEAFVSSAFDSTEAFDLTASAKCRDHAPGAQSLSDAQLSDVKRAAHLRLFFRRLPRLFANAPIADLRAWVRLDRDLRRDMRRGQESLARFAPPLARADLLAWWRREVRILSRWLGAPLSARELDWIEERTRAVSCVANRCR